MTLVELLKVMQADMPRVRAEAAKAAKRKQAHHKLGLNRSHNDEGDGLPEQWIVPTQGTHCGGRTPIDDVLGTFDRRSPHLHEEID